MNDYDEIVNELENIKNSRSWILLNKFKGGFNLFFPLGSKRKKLILFLLNLIFKIYQNVLKNNFSLIFSSLKSIFTDNNSKLNSDFVNFYNLRRSYYKNILEGSTLNGTEKILELINSKPRKGIIIFPEAVQWEPIQRPHQFLREFGKLGYICFFCNSVSDDHFLLEEKFENVFIVSGEKYLLKAVQNKMVIILCTWMGQTPFIDAIDKKYIWYDILDRIDFFSLFDKELERKHFEYINSANLVTYSADVLLQFIGNRNDAILLPNGVNFFDFKNGEKTELPYLSNNLRKRKNSIIGYFGAIEQWFDVELLVKLAIHHPEWNFILIGKIGIDVHHAKNVPNIEFLGAVPYFELASIARSFDVAIIPFIVNDLTNSVSPIKFFEYSALGLPVVATPIGQLKNYVHLPSLELATDADKFSQKIATFLSTDKLISISESAIEFAYENQWKNRIELVEEYLQSASQALYCFANIYNFQNASVFTPTFLSYEGDDFFSGGAERYLLDLYKIFSSLRIKLTIYQYGNFSWVRKFQDVEIISLGGTDQRITDFSLETVKRFNKKYYLENEKTSCLNIYSSFVEAWPLVLQPSIGISHGIFWDSPIAALNIKKEKETRNIRIINSAKNCDVLISVDTNTANWFQTEEFELAQNIKVIPNYVDLNCFFPRENYLENSEKIIILYPRRFYLPRGLYLVLDIVDEICSMFPNVEFHFVGRGTLGDTNEIMKKIEKWGERIQSYSLMPDSMVDVYQKADITLIPTLFSEGTSLSCLEAMACGNSVIATRIGGLTDLIINDFNGLLIDPNSDALKKAIILLLNNPDKMNQFKYQSTQVVRSFSKEKWVSNWMDIINSININVELNNKNVENLQLIEIYLSESPFMKLNYLKLIAFLLKKYFLLYIRVMNDDISLIESSFGRLQFLPWKEKIYSEPLLTLSDSKCTSEITTINRIVLSENLDFDLEQIISRLCLK